MSDLTDITVLIVDDQKPSRDLLKMVFQELGAKHVHSAQDGASALQIIHSFPLDIVVCDWEMPNMSGYELLKQVRASDPNIPFMMVTGRSDKNSVMAAMSTGVTDYIAKPVAPDKLSAKVLRLAEIVKESRTESDSAVTWNE